MNRLALNSSATGALFFLYTGVDLWGYDYFRWDRVSYWPAWQLDLFASAMILVMVALKLRMPITSLRQLAAPMMLGMVFIVDSMNGTEDELYYFLQGRLPPPKLAWLNDVFFGPSGATFESVTAGFVIGIASMAFCVWWASQ